MNNNNRWTEKNIPSQKGKVVIVTGSSSGIGYEAARVLANKEAKVIVAVRNMEKGEVAKAKIISQNKNTDVEVLKIDLSDLSSVKSFANEFVKNYDKLDILINNAGVMIPPYSKTKDGFELQMGTNHFGHFALTLQLLDLIKSTPNPRIVTVSSGAHKFGNINFDDLNWESRKYKPMKSYGDSKIANLYFTSELAKKLSGNDNNILVTAAHPGWTATDLQRHSGLFDFMNGFFAMSIPQGTLPTLRAATDLNAQSGNYFGPHAFGEWRGYPIKVEPNKLAKDETIARKLWDVSEELTGIKYSKN